MSFFKSDTGSISIYLIVALTAIFLFTSVLIDFSRIMVAERQTELVVKSGVRSILSAYDSGIQKYGLYAVKMEQPEAKNLFIKVVQENLSGGSKQGSFRLVTPLLEEDKVSIHMSRPLSNGRVMERQILEEMKYKAPLEHTIEILQKLTPITQNMKNTSKETKKNIKKLNQTEQMIRNIRQLEQHAQQVNVQIEDTIDHIHELERLIESKSKTNVLGELPRIQRLYREMNNISDLSEDLDRVAKLFNVSLSQAKHLHIRLKRNSSTIKQGYRSHVQSSTQNDCPEMPEKGQPTLQFNAITKVDYVDYHSHIQEIHQLDKGLRVYIKAGESDKVMKLLRERLQVATYGHSQFDGHVQRSMTSLANLMQRIKTYEQQLVSMEQCFKREKKNLDEDLQSALQDIRPTQLERQIYKQLLAFYNDFHTIETDIQNVDLKDGSIEAAKESVDMMDIVFSKISTELLSLRDELYINEYALTTFNYKASAQLATYSLSLLEQHQLDNQEVEYILYGNHKPIQNYSMAYTQIFTMRLAIRMMEGYKKYKYLMDPRLIAIAAVANGTIKAVQDVKLLSSGKEVEVSTFTPRKMTMNYKDHLRLLLLLHNNRTQKVARIQSLIQLNTGQNLAESYTYVETNTTASIKLWFIPGVAKALSMTNVLGGVVEGNRYYFQKKMMMSY